MIYEVRTYTLKPGSVPQFEENFAKALPSRERFSKLGAFWHTEIGPLNQVIHVWPYESVEERNSIRAEAVKDPNWPPHNPPDMYVAQETEIFIPAPFMRPLGGDQALGNIYEMRIYTYRTGTMANVLKLWAESVPHREKFSPLAAGMYSDIGGLNKWVHIWPYKDLEERNRVRAEAAKTPHWPPATREFLVKQENKILVPASFS
ncbi:MAG: NIPSNAP family protein, partial [Dehalococcoidia bacterium]|nr:NIPSNAP family protein [Dehalococcoidia bacterium]